MSKRQLTRCLAVCIVPVMIVANAGAQKPIPIRTIGPILATSTENVGEAPSVRATSDGHVIVGSGARQRVYAFDSTLTRFTIVVDSGSGTGTGSTRPMGLIPYLGDSTLLPDLGAGALLVLDGKGKQVRSMAPPRAQDLSQLGSPADDGRPGLDAKGGLVYKANNSGRVLSKLSPSTHLIAEMNADSAAIVRGDFDTRRVDTIAWVRTPIQGRVDGQMTENPAGGPPSISMHTVINPLVVPDQWSLLSDGTIAIVRVQDYHIDWIDPDGTKRSSPKMPMDWRRYTEAERRQRADSIRQVSEEQARKAIASAPSVRMTMKVDMSVVPDSELPSFWPPIAAGSVMSDLEGHVWILPTTSTNAANGFTYDLVDRTGQVVERVQLPKDHVLAGFGPHNMLYMTKAAGKNTYLVRALLKGTPK